MVVAGLLYVAAIALTFGKGGLIAGMMFLNMSALMFGAGAITAGFRSKDSGNCFWDGVGDFIRNEWAMQVAISSTLVIATFGLSLAVNGMIGAAGGLAKLIGKGIGKKAKALPNTAGNNDGLGKLNWSRERADGMTTEQHVRLHEVTNNVKARHSVFNGDAVHVTNSAWSNKSNAIISTNVSNGNIVYKIPFKNAGLTGGKSVTVPLPCDSVTIVIQKGTNNLLVTAFPSA